MGIEFGDAIARMAIGMLREYVDGSLRVGYLNTLVAIIMPKPNRQKDRKHIILRPETGMVFPVTLAKSASFVRRKSGIPAK